MRTRPWSIIILAALYILGPVFNILWGAWILNLTPVAYFSAFLATGTHWEYFSVLALYPIGGMAIYAIKPWSYPVYLFVTAVSFYSGFTSWWKHPQIFSIWTLLVSTAIDVGLVTYFLLPAVRVTYFDKRLRWWEAKTRYQVDLPAKIESSSCQLKCTVQNISEGGAFIHSGRKLNLNDTVQLSFTLLGKPVVVSAKIVHRRWKGFRGYGLEFVHSPESANLLKHITHGLHEIGLETRTGNVSRLQSFKAWVVSLRHGKGWVPEVPIVSAAVSLPPRKLPHARPKSASSVKKAA